MASEVRGARWDRILCVKESKHVVQRSWLPNVSEVCQHPCWLILPPISPWGWWIKFFQNKNILCVHLEATEKEKRPRSQHPSLCWVELSNTAVRIDGIWPPFLPWSLTEHCCAWYRRWNGEQDRVFVPKELIVYLNLFSNELGFFKSQVFILFKRRRRILTIHCSQNPHQDLSHYLLTRETCLSKNQRWYEFSSWGQAHLQLC